jgi:hypothetical protein
MTFRHLVFGLMTGAALSGCGGGSAGSALPHVPLSAAPSPAPTLGSSSAEIAVTIPPASSNAAALRRQPRYVSTHTQSASIAINDETPIVVNLSASSPNCVAIAGGGRTCTVSVNAPVGVDTFAETLYASTDAAGAALSQGKTSATIAAGKANTVSLTLDGMIASLALMLANPTPPEGTPAQIGLTVNFNDASGASIIGNDAFVTPVTLSDSDSSGITSLSKTTLNSPADASALVVNYSGAALTQAVFGAAAGSIVAPNATLTPQVPGPLTFNDYPTFGFDNQRDAFNPNSTAVTTASVPALHLAWQSSLNDYNTQTQPVLATEISGHAGVLFVGGGSGNVYAYDALSGALIWTAPTGQATMSTCGSSGTSYLGIGGTAAYDPASQSLYVVGNSNTALNAYPSNSLIRLDAATGKLLGQVNVAPSPAGAGESNYTHTAVTLSNGIAYVGTGSNCDVSSWRGRVVAVSVPAMTIANTFFTLWDPNNARGAGAQPWGGGSIWGWGGVSLDLAGNVLTGVGNADNGTSHGQIQAPFVAAPLEYSGYAETLLELSPDLSTALASNHPISPSVYGGVSTDLDVQGTPLVIGATGACGPIVALQDKAGTLSIYNEKSLSSGPIAQYAMAPSSWYDSYFGGPAYSSATGLLYADVASSTSPSLFPPGLIAIDPGCGVPSVTWHAAFGPDSTAAGIPRAVPAVSAGGVIFAGTVDSTGSGGSLWALNASTGAILNGGVPVLQTSGYLRMAPTIDGNWLFVLDNNGNMYGLTVDPNYKAIAVKRRAANARQRLKWVSGTASRISP